VGFFCAVGSFLSLLLHVTTVGNFDFPNIRFHHVLGAVVMLRLGGMTCSSFVSDVLVDMICVWMGYHVV